MTEKQPIVSFGIITDIHYTDNDDRWNYHKTFMRRYRNSLKLVQQACEYWQKNPNRISFLIQLGDIIDRLCHLDQTSDRALTRVLKEFQHCPTIFHIWGNHELYNFTRDQLVNGPLCSFDTKDISPYHYGVIQVCSNLKILAIDTYEMSLLGIDKNSDSYLEALNVFRQYNLNDDVNDTTGLEGYDQRFAEWNGGLNKKQLDWLKQELSQARIRRENVIIIGTRTNMKYILKNLSSFSFEGHIPIHPKATDEKALIWNYTEVLEILRSFADVVLAYFGGHCHEGGYYLDEKTIHYFTFNAVVECSSDENSFATVYVYDECLKIEGMGVVSNYEIPMKIK